jgi:long-chain acyl-CoA synthetase
MLYDRWRQISQAHARELALRDDATGRSWSFKQLAAAAESGDADASKGDVAFPQGSNAEFVIEVLRAWRINRAVCPLDEGQTRLDLENLPAGCAHVKTTSATTGAARAILFTGEQLAADAQNIVATMGLRTNWPNLGVISLAHSYGFSSLVLPLLLHGIPLILAPSPLPEEVRRAADSLDHLTLPAVPALWRAWHEAGVIPTNVQLAISAGAPLPLALEQAVHDRVGLKIHNFYGASECGGIAYDATETPRDNATCVGSAMRNVSLSVGSSGGLEVRSRAVGQSYWPAHDDTLGGGCFRTTDLAEVKEGMVFLRGRADEQINVAGRKVSPDAIERALLAQPCVRECLVFGMPEQDVSRGDLIVACVAGTPEAAAETLKQGLLRVLPAWQVPREWVFVDALPVNARGKLSRAEWRRRFVEGK